MRKVPWLFLLTGSGLSLVLATSLPACGGTNNGGAAGGSSGSSGTTSNGANTGGDAGDTPGTDASTTSPGCGMPATQTGQLANQTITVNGTSRSFALSIPAAYDGNKAFPIVLAFHGDGGDGAGLRSYFGLEGQPGGDAIFAYPDGLGQTWEIDAHAGLMADIAFVDAIVAQLQKTYCTNARVFFTGFSRGAYFVNQLACRTKSPLKGIATHSGGGPWSTDPSESNASGDLVCPSPAVPALQVHGASDGTVDITEGQKSRDYWSATNGCNTTTAATDPSPCVAYQGCTRAEVWCQIPGMDHTLWPSGMAGKVTMGFFTSIK